MNPFGVLRGDDSDDPLQLSGAAEKKIGPKKDAGPSSQTASRAGRAKPSKVAQAVREAKRESGRGGGGGRGEGGFNRVYASVNESSSRNTGFGSVRGGAPNDGESGKPYERLTLTLEEYEKGREEKRKTLQLGLKTGERNADFDEEFKSMKQLSSKKGNDGVFIKLGSDKVKRKEAAKKKAKRKKTYNITEFLKLAERGRYYSPGGSGPASISSGPDCGTKGGYGGANVTSNLASPPIEIQEQFPRSEAPPIERGTRGGYGGANVTSNLASPPIEIQEQFPHSEAPPIEIPLQNLALASTSTSTDLPKLFVSKHFYTDVVISPLYLNNKDGSVVYEGLQGRSVPVIIKQCIDIDDKHSYKMCKEHMSFYILKGLEKFSHKGIEYCVYEGHTSLAQWINVRENVAMNHEFTNAFLQILRDVCHGLHYLYSIGKYHGRICSSSIAVVEDDKTNKIRGKLMNFYACGDIKSDCHSFATMISDNVLGGRFPVDESYKMNMVFFSNFFRHCAEKSQFRELLPVTHTHPLFLSIKMRIMVRVWAMLEYHHLNQEERKEVLMHIPRNRNGLTWKKFIPNKHFLDPDGKRTYCDTERSKNEKNYGDWAHGFMRYARNILMHIHEDEKYPKTSLETVELALEDIWPGFVAALFNGFYFKGIWLFEIL